MPIQQVLEGRVPVKIWTKEVEEVAQKQLLNTASLPFIFKHVAVMPDVHFGIGATVGTVIATRNAIVPAAVGVDIGCGMGAVKLDISADKILDKIKDIRHSIERSVPVGFARNNKPSAMVESWPGWITANVNGLDSDMRKTAMDQMGSLGGGNHFIEICLDTERNPWVMLHSGSRGVGNQLAKVHIGKAKNIMKAYYIKLLDPDLAYLAEGTREFEDYMRDLNWCQDYAMENRREMMRRVLHDIAYAVNGGMVIGLKEEVYCHHNYTEMEHHFGENVLVTRKGAVRARKGDMGIIPGSMGTGSFIVRGLGNEESFCSCSHGAGRKMSRKQANATFTVKDLEEQTRGVECRKDQGVLDEAPGAYKDINEVIKDQSDLVEVVTELKQVMCIKG